MDAHAREHLHESPAVVTVPLILLAIPSVVIGWFTIEPLLFGGFFGDAIVVQERHDVLAELGTHFEGPGAFVAHAFVALSVPSLYLAAAGAVFAWYLYLKRPDLPGVCSDKLGIVYRTLVNKYYFDWFNETIIAAGARRLGGAAWEVGDQGIIDGAIVNGSARGVALFSRVIQQLQTGYLYHYAFTMIIGLVVLIGWLVLRA